MTHAASATRIVVSGGAIIGSSRPTANGNERLPCGSAGAF
jgi:hypothetical protein